MPYRRYSFDGGIPSLIVGDQLAPAALGHFADDGIEPIDPSDPKHAIRLHAYPDSRPGTIVRELYHDVGGPCHVSRPMQTVKLARGVWFTTPCEDVAIVLADLRGAHGSRPHFFKRSPIPYYAIVQWHQIVMLPQQYHALIAALSNVRREATRRADDFARSLALKTQEILARRELS